VYSGRFPMKFCVKKILVSHGFIAIAMKSTVCVSVNNVMLPHSHSHSRNMPVASRLDEITKCLLLLLISCGYSLLLLTFLPYVTVAVMYALWETKKQANCGAENNF